MSAHYTLPARFTFWLVRGVETLVTCLPHRWAVGLGGALGAAMWALVPIRRRVVWENITEAFPEMSRRERRRLVRRFHIHLGRWVLEQFFVPRLDTVARGTFPTEEGRERRDRFPAEHGGVIVVTGHLGSWELMGAHFAREGFPITAVAKPLHNGFLNDHVVRSRARAGLRILFTGSALSAEVTECLARGEIVAFVADQDTRQFGTFVDFMGRPASTPRGPAMYALRTGKPLFPVFTVRERGVHHRIIYGEPIFPPSDPPDVDRAVQEMTQAFTHQLEEVVRRFPEQYFWFHRRWKTRPEMVRPKRRRRAGLTAPQGD